MLSHGSTHPLEIAATAVDVPCREALGSIWAGGYFDVEVEDFEPLPEVVPLPVPLPLVVLLPLVVPLPLLPLVVPLPLPLVVFG